MERFLEQRYTLRFCVRLSKTGKDTQNMIKEANGDAAMSRSGVFEWHKLFRERRERVEDDDPPDVHRLPRTNKTCRE
ncbi:uncharacterized protein TNCV_2845581 [Trichonephila clavipes]|nr:uncharacterized protein TNCV_2845581 [Trichonephila clavipes]